MKLRDYQQRLIDAVRDEIKRGRKKVLMALPTGEGKTHILGSYRGKVP